MNIQKRILPQMSVVVAGLILLSGCASSAGSSGTPSADASGAISTDVDRQADGYEDNQICVINKLATNTFMNWTLAEDLPAGGYGEELLSPGSKSCKNGQAGSTYVEVDGYFMTEFEDGQTWRLTAKNQSRHNPGFFISTESGPHRTSWGCAWDLNQAQTVVADEGKYKFTVQRIKDFTASRYVVTVSKSDGAVNLQVDGCRGG